MSKHKVGDLVVNVVTVHSITGDRRKHNIGYISEIQKGTAEYCYRVSWYDEAGEWVTAESEATMRLLKSREEEYMKENA